MTATPTSASTITRANCLALDAADPLSAFRAQFRLPSQTIYLDGNSLGALPVRTAARVVACVEQQWGQGLIASWNAAGWVDLPQRLGDKIARLIGAPPGTTVVGDSTSVNLYKLLAVALHLRPQRRVILAEAGEFPTDHYIAQGLIAWRDAGYELRRVPSGALAAAVDEDVAVLLLSHVNYRSGAMHDMAALTGRAHAQGALVLWDLAHSAGALPLALDDCEVDLAVGCGYKYLNGGPGAPAFAYVAERHHVGLRTPLTGWFGHARPFAFEPDYQAAPDIRALLCGTPPILSMCALEAGVDLMLEVPMDALRAKSLALSELMMNLVEQELAGFGFEIATPRAPARRGSQVSLRHEQAWPISQALIAGGVIGDFRAPDVLRFGLAPLYLTYADIWDAIAHLRELMRSGDWNRIEHRAPAKVT